MNKKTLHVPVFMDSHTKDIRHVDIIVIYRGLRTESLQTRSEAKRDIKVNNTEGNEVVVLSQWNVSHRPNLKWCVFP